MEDRKFVAEIVGFADRLLVALWPALVLISHADAASANRVLMPLRAYIEFILRRSRATCSTLLVALYYLTLLPPSIPRQKFATDQLGETERVRYLQCQRRMFLAALILAWKYTQERSYSSRVWAQISGLSSTEINANEVVFLSTIDWRVYIPDAFFRRWTATVLYYTILPDRSLPDSLLNCAKDGRDWPLRLLLPKSSCGHLGIRNRSEILARRKICICDLNNISGTLPFVDGRQTNVSAQDSKASCTKATPRILLLDDGISACEGS